MTRDGRVTRMRSSTAAPRAAPPNSAPFHSQKSISLQTESAGARRTKPDIVLCRIGGLEKRPEIWRCQNIRRSAKFGWLKTLKNSARNCRLTVFANLKFLSKEKSKL